MRRMGDTFMPQSEPAIETTIETTSTREARARRPSAERKNPSSDTVWDGVRMEPPSGFEPETYTLRDHERSC